MAATTSPRTERRAAPGGPARAPRRNETGSKPHSASDPTIYARAWKAYLCEPTVRSVRAAIGGSTDRAVRLVNRGLPEWELAPLRQKYQQALALAAQMDTDEGARALALGRGALRTTQARLVAALAGRTFSPDTLSDRDLLRALVAVQRRVEETAADPDQEQQRLRASESLGKALGGLLESVVKRLMPNVGDALPTVEDLEALDLPRLTPPDDDQD